MANSYKKLGQGVLTGAATQDTMYTVPADTEAIVKLIVIVNTDSSNHTVEVWHDGHADTNAILPSITIEAGGWLELDGPFTMEAADTLQAEGSAATSLTYTVYGVEVS